jgi:hypothetical protein
MGSILNLTPFAVAEAAGKDAEGRGHFMVAVKATYAWTSDGTTRLVESQAVLEADAFAGDPASSGLLRATELTPPKPRVDVLLAGALVFPAAISEIDVTVQVGKRLVKTARVFAKRIWVPAVLRDEVPSRIVPLDRVPIAWERAFGGTDRQDSRCVEMRNPAGSGVTRQPRSLDGMPAPNFEDPRQILKSCNDRPAPMGFGPVAPHWDPRRRYAGTYDQAWQKSRAPLLPTDFNALFWNVATADQQLDLYPAGELVRLESMTKSRQEAFKLPAFEVPVLFCARKELHKTVAWVDTITIEPEERRFSLVAHAAYAPEPNLLALRHVVVGKPSRSHLAALESGKPYFGPGAHGAGVAS